MAERFAIYLVPPEGSALWERGCRWLGRDPENGTACDPPRVPGFADDEIGAITESARMYGFHGTLKAPFHLAGGANESGLLDKVGLLADAQPSLEMPELRVGTLNGFLALRPVGASDSLDALAERVVAALDEFRAPLAPAERERRLASGLSARRRELLDRWGYPYVLEEYRFHMTLSRRLDAAEQGRLKPWLEEWFAPALNPAPAYADIGVFAQPAGDAAFVLRRRFKVARTG